MPAREAKLNGQQTAQRDSAHVAREANACHCERSGQIALPVVHPAHFDICTCGLCIQRILTTETLTQFVHACEDPWRYP